MGLRFRRSISIVPGVKLNFGKTGMSVSAGVPGFRKTFHTSGKVTTSVGIPGTGLYYVTTENKKNGESIPKMPERQNQYRNSPNVNEDTLVSKRITKDVALSIHKVADETIDWTEFIETPSIPDDAYNKELWKYFQSVAGKILSGDIDTYLEVIKHVNPLNDLLDYGTSFEFGTDSPLIMEVEFQINSDNIDIDEKTADFQDYVCSVAIRIARDIFALLPVQKVVVHAQKTTVDILSVCFDKMNFKSIKFGFIDPSETVKKFQCNMNFIEGQGFLKVNRLEILS